MAAGAQAEGLPARVWIIITTAHMAHRHTLGVCACVPRKIIYMLLGRRQQHLQQGYV